MEEVQDRSFQTAEAKVEWILGLRFGKAKSERVPQGGILVNEGPSRIGQANEFGRLVEGFTNGIIDCLSEDFKAARRTHPKDLGMATADGEA